MGLIDGKRILFIVAPKNFRDEELQIPKHIIEENGGKVDLCSVKIQEITGMMGHVVVPDLELKNAKQESYDMVVFVGGNGAEFYFGNSAAQKLAKSFEDANKFVTAICIAPGILAEAGVLRGKKATVYMGTRYEKMLQDGKAILVREHLVRDGKVITADGPRAAKEFGIALVEALADG